MSTATEASALRVAPREDDYGVAGRPEWLDINWREHLRSVLVDGAQVNYIELGEGPPLAFVHGLSGCWQNWLENIPRSARKHRVIAVDLPGFGHSELPSEEISIPGYGRFVDAFLEKVGVERAAVIGSSMGGFIAAEVAISHPGRVDKLVLVGAVGASDLRRVRRASNAARTARLWRPAAAAVAAYAAKNRLSLLSRPGMRRAMLRFVAHYPERLGAEICCELLGGSGKPGFVDAFRACVTYDFRDRLPEISCPTLLVWGRNDRIVALRDAGEYERLIPGARLVLFEKTGHVPMLERPARFNRLVEEFLAE